MRCADVGAVPWDGVTLRCSTVPVACFALRCCFQLSKAALAAQGAVCTAWARSVRTAPAFEGGGEAWGREDAACGGCDVRARPRCLSVSVRDMTAARAASWRDVA